MPQNLTPPDQWLAQQGGQPTGQLTNPDEWIAKDTGVTQIDPLLAGKGSFPAGRVNVSGQVQENTSKFPLPTPPAPSMSWKDSALAAAGEAPKQIRGWVDSIGDSFLEPSTLTSTVMGTALAGAPLKLAAPAVGATNMLTRMGQRAHQGKGTSWDEALPDFLTGATGEAGGRLLFGTGSKIGRAEVDPLGKEVQSYFGKNVGAHQLTESPKLDFMANVAATGMGGKKGMAEFAEKQSSGAVQHLTNEADKLSPPRNNPIMPRGTPTTPIEVSTGKDLQNTLAAQLKDLGRQSQQKYGAWLQQNGALRAQDPITGDWTGPTIEQLHNQRSSFLEQARDAFRAGDSKGQQEAMSQADKALQQIKATVPNPNEYETINNWYRGEKNRLDNDMIYNLRRSTKGEDVLKSVLGKRLKTYTDLGENAAMDNNELFHALKRAVPPTEWKRTQSDLLHELVSESVDAEGTLQADKLKKIFGALSPESQSVLFGTKATDEIIRTVAVMERAQKLKAGGPGQLAISVRQPSAIMNLAEHGLLAPIAGVLGGAAAHTAGFGSVGTLGSAAFITASPYIFMKALTTDVGRRLLTKAATTQGPAKLAAKNALTRYFSQLGATEAENTVYPDTKMKSLTPPPETEP